jgi:p-aminobenzoyl-glutamate transporter AbgT
MHYPLFLRVASLFFFFYVYLKQYDLHKAELGKFRALLLSSAIHFAINASAMLIAFFLEPDIDAETIFSAQQGE